MILKSKMQLSVARVKLGWEELEFLPLLLISFVVLW